MFGEIIESLLDAVLIEGKSRKRRGLSRKKRREKKQLDDPKSALAQHVAKAKRDAESEHDDPVELGRVAHRDELFYGRGDDIIGDRSRNRLGSISRMRHPAKKSKRIGREVWTWTPKPEPREVDLARKMVGDRIRGIKRMKSQGKPGSPGGKPGKGDPWRSY